MDLKKYFNSGSQKQDLSSETSTSGDDPKKIRDGSLDDSDNPDHVFTEWLFSPDCLKILYNYIKNVEKQIHGIHSKIEETKISQIKGEQRLVDLKETVRKGKEGKIFYKDVSEGNRIKVYFDETVCFKALLKTINGKKLLCYIGYNWFVFLFLCFDLCISFGGFSWVSAIFYFWVTMQL